MITLPEIQLRPRLKKEAGRIKNLLDESKYDIEIWCECIGFDLRRINKGILISPVVAIIRGKIIYLNKGLTKKQEIEYIAHEYCHWKFHAACISYEELHPMSAGHDEAQAIEFSRIVLKHQ